MAEGLPSDNDDCYGEKVGYYVSGPLLARLYTIGKADQDGLSEVLSEALNRLIANLRGDDSNETEAHLLLGVIAMSVITDWYMADLHICDILRLCAEKAVEIADVTVESLTEEVDQ